MSFYSRSPGAEKLLQGDILFPVPFAAFAITQVGLITGSATGKVEVSDMTKSSVESGQLVASFTVSAGLVLNQSCDLDDDHSQEEILVARIYPCEKRFPKWKKDDLNCLKQFVGEFKNAGKRPQYFYLPAESEQYEIPPSVAYLLEVQTFSRKDYDNLASIRRLRLSTDALGALQERISYCFGRYGAPNDLYYSPSEWKQVNSSQGNAAKIDKADEKATIVAEPKIEPQKRSSFWSFLRGLYWSASRFLRQEGGGSRS